MACEGNHQGVMLGFMDEMQTDLAYCEDFLTLNQLISSSNLLNEQELLY